MICISIIPYDMEGLFLDIERIGKRGDIIECRLDLIADPDPNFICKRIERPLILTCRKKEEGGLFKGEENERMEIIRNCLNSGARFVDVEIRTAERLIQEIEMKKRNTGLILSYHNMSRTPSRKLLMKNLHKGISLGADIVKIVTMANRYEDNLKVLSLIPEAKRLGQEIIAFCAGEMGKWGRLFSWSMGSKILYVALDEKGRTAPGQFTIDEIEELVRICGS